MLVVYQVVNTPCLLELSKLSPDIQPLEGADHIYIYRYIDSIKLKEVTAVIDERVNV